MAFGVHWEWRGFGELSSSLEERIRALRPLFPDSQVVTDRYLWSPGCSINFKLRFGDFKIKRCLDLAEGGIARWQEDPGENYSFPLAAGVFGEVVTALGGAAGAAGEALASEAELLERAGAAIAGLQVVAVAKERWQYGAPVLEDGIIEFKENTLSILTSYISSLKDIKRANIDQLLQDAEKELSDQNILDQKKSLINQKIDLLKSITVN